MSPDRLKMIRRRADTVPLWRGMDGATAAGIKDRRDLLVEVDRLQRENEALRRGQGNYEGKQS